MGETLEAREARLSELADRKGYTLEKHGAGSPITTLDYSLVNKETFSILHEFVVLTFVHLLGPIVYGALWLLVPFAPGDPSPLEGGLAAAQDWFAGLRGQCRAAPPPPDAPRSGKPNGLGTGAVPGSPLV